MTAHEIFCHQFVAAKCLLDKTYEFPEFQATDFGNMFNLIRPSYVFASCQRLLGTIGHPKMCIETAYTIRNAATKKAIAHNKKDDNTVLTSRSTYVGALCQWICERSVTIPVLFRRTPIPHFTV